jgi:phosphatidylglycerophosphate synthase
VAEPVVGGPGLTTRTPPRGDRLSWTEYSAQWLAVHVGVDARRSSLIVSLIVQTWLRFAYAVGRLLAAMGLPPGAVTVAGVVASLLVPVAVLVDGTGLFVAAGLVLVAAIADSADGAVAVISSRTSPLGSFYDSVADRVGEASWLLGLWLAGVPGVLVTGCGALAWLHEYARARAAVSGMTGIGEVTVAERPTRVILVILGLVLGGVAALISPRLAPGVITVVVCLWAVLGLLGAARLLTAIRAALT